MGNWSRWAALTGVVYAGLLAAVFFVGGSTPDTDWSAQRVVSWYTSHHDSQQASVYLLAYCALFAVLFAAALRSYLRGRSGSDGLTALGFGGGVAFAVGIALAAGLTSAIVDVPAKIDPSAEQALNVLSNDLFYITLAVGLVAFGIGNGLAIVLSGGLPTWLGWLGILIGVVAAIPVIGWFALIATIAWVAIVSILMFLRSGQAPASPA